MEIRALFGMTVEQLTEAMAGLGQRPYRARQLADALYRQRAPSLAEITTLPAALRAQLADARWVVGQPELAQTAKSVDGTERYLVRLADGETVETVWMPDGDLPEDDDRVFRRATICVSSQVGCAVNCQFCLTARLGQKRNLTAGEIAGQVAAVLNRHQVAVGTDRINLVFMGMGEPFLNYDAFMDAVRLLHGEMGVATSRMTVSTSGIEPARPKLALSLNASNDTVREQVMPITRKWNIAALLEAVQSIPLGKREYVTFEYVLLGGVNDQPEHAAEVLALLKGMPAKVNLIVWNPGPGIAYRQPTPEAADAFHKLLIAGGIPTFTRRPRGRDIYAACGQLKRTVESELVMLA
jgi:23S rRNA (adenine2503-C2)-methyltransferase